MVVVVSPYFSIIIPVYNTEKYLRECLDSIREQMFPDWECICVDDGSTDNSPEILDEYAAKDKRFQIIHQINQGVAAARNFAMRQIHGQFFTFVDSDDILLKDALKHWHQWLTSYPVDIIVETKIACFSTVQDLSISEQNLLQMPFRLQTPKAVADDFFQNKFLGFVWGKIYCRELADDLSFPQEIAMWEDALAFLWLLDKTKDKISWGIAEGSHYGYRQNPDSACANFTPKKRLDTLYVLSEQFRIMKNNGYSAEEMKASWLRNSNSYYTQGAYDCYMRLDKIERQIFEELVYKIVGYINYFPYDFFMWLRLHITHGKMDCIIRSAEFIYYGIRKRIFK